MRGVQLIAAMTLVAELQDFVRFESARQLMGYVGPGPGRILQQAQAPPGQHHQGRQQRRTAHAGRARLALTDNSKVATAARDRTARPHLAASGSVAASSGSLGTHMLVRRAIGRGILAAAMLIWVSSPASTQSDAPNEQQAASAARSEPALKAQLASAAASAPARNNTQRTACVKEGESCAPREARCCPGLLCVGVRNSFCTRGF